MTTTTQNEGATDLNSVSGGDYVQREALKPGDYPSVELIGVETSETEKYGKYTYLYVRHDDGAEAKIGLRRFPVDDNSRLATAKRISLVSAFKVIAASKGIDMGDRNEFVSKLESGAGNGARFGVTLKLVGKSKQYTFRPAQDA